MEIVRARNLTSRETARLIGVSEASVKRWADSGLLPATKTAGGHRRFRPEDVAIFKRSGLSEEGPRAIKRLFPARLRGRQVESKEAFGSEDEAALVEDTFRSLMDGRAEEVSALLVNLHLRGHTVAAIADGFLCAAMSRIGDLWHRGEISVAQEHVATRTALTALHDLKMVLDLPAEKRLVALCCSTEEDFHDLPLQLAMLTLESCGLEVFNLGTSTPFFALAESVLRFRPHLVCIASTILHSLDRAAREYAEFHKAAQRARVSIVMGGAGFSNAEVRKRFPADLHADNFRQLETFVAALSP